MVKKKTSTKVSHSIQVVQKTLIDQWYDPGTYEVSEEIYNLLKTSKVVATGLVILL